MFGMEIFATCEVKPPVDVPATGSAAALAVDVAGFFFLGNMKSGSLGLRPKIK